MDLWYEMNENHSMWGPGAAVVLGPAAPKQGIMSSASGSAPSTPPYSHPHSLELESRMIDSTMAQLGGVPQQHATCTVIAGSDGSRHGGPAAVQPPSSSSSRHLKQASSVGAPVGTRRGAKQFVDPCDIAPIKKRRIQLELLSPDEREKVLVKREKNKVAAEKCRVKRREKVQQVRTEYDDYLDTNEALSDQVQRLKEQKKLLQQLLDKHHCVLSSPA